MKKILLNSFGKTILCLLVALLSGGTAWAADEVYKTASFNGDYSTNVYNYRTTWSHTTNNFTVSLTNFRNSSWFIITIPWSYVACGGTNSPATITTAAPIDESITKVDLTTSRTNNLSSIVLQTSMDYVNWVNVGTFEGGNTKEATIPEDKRSSNLFYRILVTCTGDGEDDVRISQVRYYREVPDPNAVATPVIDVDNNGNYTNPFETSTKVKITCATSGATIQYSTDGGSNWQNYTGAFTLSETTTVMAKATKSGQPASQVASKTFTKQSDVRDVTWDLTEAPTGAKSNSQVTWTTTTTGEYFAVMSLSKSTSSTSADNYLGGSSNEHTRFYQNQILRIAPLEGYSILYVEVETVNNTSTAGLTGNSWTNAASTTTTGNKVKVIPQDGTENLSVIISAMTQVTGVNVEYTPIFHPEITIAENEVSATSAGKEGTPIAVVYERIDKMSAAEVLISDENGEAVTWITATLNDDYNIEYTIAANPTLESRTAYLAVHVEGIYSNAVTVTQEAAISVTIAWFGYSTLYYGEKNLKLPADVEALTYKKGDVKMVVSHRYANEEVIPAGTAVVLKGEPGTYAFVESNTTGIADPDNELKGFDVATLLPEANDSYYYVLSVKKGSTPENGGANTVGFYWNASDGGKFTSAAHKAYLELPKSFASVKSFYLFSEDEPTGIDEFNFDEDSNAIYNLAGQRINKMQRGINIVNGKKILK